MLVPISGINWRRTGKRLSSRLSSTEKRWHVIQYAQPIRFSLTTNSRSELNALRQELAALRDTTTQYDMSVERNMHGVLQRLQALEARSVAPRVAQAMPAETYDSAPQCDLFLARRVASRRRAGRNAAPPPSRKLTAMHVWEDPWIIIAGGFLSAYCVNRLIGLRERSLTLAAKKQKDNAKETGFGRRRAARRADAPARHDHPVRSLGGKRSHRNGATPHRRGAENRPAGASSAPAFAAGAGHQKQKELERVTPTGRNQAAHPGQPKIKNIYKNNSATFQPSACP